MSATLTRTGSGCEIRGVTDDLRWGHVRVDMDIPERMTVLWLERELIEHLSDARKKPGSAIKITVEFDE